VRIDQLAVLRGLAPSRSAAQRLIESQALRWRAAGRGDEADDANANAHAKGNGLDSNGQPATPGGWRTPRKAGDVVPDDCELESTDTQLMRYVSRGGLKLAGAMAHVGWSPAGQWCLDVGQSTGGFTDCLLQHDAAGVVGLDVGRDQLHPRLQAHPKVVAMQGFNARDYQPDLIAQAMAAPGDASWQARDVNGFDAMVGDVSFISQVKVWPGVLPLLKPGASVLMLVKPQFELQPEDIGKGGLVKHASAYKRVEAQLQQAAAEQGLEWLDFFESAITGGDGNREFFMWARTPAQRAAAPQS
jgi:23S rRNA (cytidine1920-2'-O)/16S rRNA (cytidine1409-2'-O)-methyltransferase